jgi:uncharacterized protein YukE
VPQFLVDATSLEALSIELGALHARLLAMPTVVDGFEGLLGGDAMDQAVQDFCTHWHHAVGEVADEIEDLTGGLGKAARAYQEIDDRVRQRAMTGWLTAPRETGGRPAVAIAAMPRTEGGMAQGPTLPPLDSPQRCGGTGSQREGQADRVS